MIQPAAPSPLHAGRASANAGAPRAGVGDTGPLAFASLLDGGGGGDGDLQAAASPAIGRQDDAADGTTMPPPMMAMDASWLSLILPDPLTGGVASDPASTPPSPDGTAVHPRVARPVATVPGASVQPGAVSDPPSAMPVPAPAAGTAAPDAAPVSSTSFTVVDRGTPAPTRVAGNSDLPAVAGDLGSGDEADATAAYETSPSGDLIAVARAVDLPIEGGRPVDPTPPPSPAERAAAIPFAAAVAPAARTATLVAPAALRRQPEPAFRAFRSTAEPAGLPRAPAMSPVAAASIMADAPSATIGEEVRLAPAVPERSALSSEPAAPAPDARATRPSLAGAAPAVPVVAPPAAIPSAIAAAPAGEVFAAAIHAAGRQSWRDDREADGASAALVIAAAAPLAGTVAAAGARDDATLDMRQGGWPGAMVDHIERLRDAADATDTRIRLVPDALGSIDVSLARRDDGVQVTLTADRPATQAMLADARPQLTDLAQARGLRLADSGVAGGGTGAQGFADHRRQPAPTPVSGAVPAAPASAATTTTDDRDPAGSRVA